jgi:hypothetical protein
MDWRRNGEKGLTVACLCAPHLLQDWSCGAPNLLQYWVRAPKAKWLVSGFLAKNHHTNYSVGPVPDHLQGLYRTLVVVHQTCYRS